MAGAREATLEALLHVDESEGYSNIVLDKTLNRYALDVRDAALASALFYGVLERRLTLDYIIGRYSKMPVDKLDGGVREILRIGLCQIFYMDKIPPSAAVNEAVTLVKQRKPKAAGFVNAVLRSALRGKDSFSFPDEKKDPLLAKSIRYSCPGWLISLWENSYGEECAHEILESFFVHPPVFLRVNSVKIKEEDYLEKLRESGVEAERVPGVPGALALTGAGNVVRLPGFEDGLFHVQDASSQLCCMLMGAKPGQRVLDVCSAPGGKAFTLAEWMENTGELAAFDQYKGKVGLIRQGAERLGLSCIRAEIRDALSEKDMPPKADIVLCDAPCSGLGIIRRKPEIRYKSAQTLDSLPDLQYRILSHTASLVKAGGRLYYSTCTLNPAENGAVAERFLKEHPEFRPLPLALPAALSHAVQEPENQLTLMPQVHGTDGFFISAFEKPI